MNKIVILNMFRAKNKQSFFALHQIYNKIKSFDDSIDVNFHTLWDTENELGMKNDKKWEDLIDNYGFNLTSYNKEFFRDYWMSAYDYDEPTVTLKCSKYFPIYQILMMHYLRRVKLYDYCLIYDDDILINYDLVDIIKLMKEKTSVLITEPFNCNCDKVLIKKILEMYGPEAVTLYKKETQICMDLMLVFKV